MCAVMKARKWIPLAIMLGLAAAYGGPLLITYIASGEQERMHVWSGIERAISRLPQASERSVVRNIRQLFAESSRSKSPFQ
jgi:hypothetical protein